VGSNFNDFWVAYSFEEWKIDWMCTEPRAALARDHGFASSPPQNLFEPEMANRAADEVAVSSMGRFPLAKLLAGALLFSLLVVAPGARAAAKTAIEPTVQSTVMAVTADSIKIKTGRHAGLKITVLADIDQKSSTGPAANVETLKIDPFTRITVDDLPGTVADIKAGMIVQVTRGMDPDSASSIDAHSAPPPAKKSPASKQDTKAKKGNTTAKAAFRKIVGDKVIAVSPVRITIGQPGAKTARAYYVTAMTTVTIDGVAASPGDLRNGMDVTVRGDSTTAEEIVAHKNDAYMSQ
jgi:hypothetical protein